PTGSAVQRQVAAGKRLLQQYDDEAGPLFSLDTEPVLQPTVHRSVLATSKPPVLVINTEELDGETVEQPEAPSPEHDGDVQVDGGEVVVRPRLLPPSLGERGRIEWVGDVPFGDSVALAELLVVGLPGGLSEAMVEAVSAGLVARLDELGVRRASEALLSGGLSMLVDDWEVVFEFAVDDAEVSTLWGGEVEPGLDIQVGQRSGMPFVSSESGVSGSVGSSGTLGLAGSREWRVRGGWSRTFGKDHVTAGVDLSGSRDASWQAEQSWSAGAGRHVQYQGWSAYFGLSAVSQARLIPVGPDGRALSNSESAARGGPLLGEPVQYQLVLGHPREVAAT